jgi:hypothetical protein
VRRAPRKAPPREPTWLDELAAADGVDPIVAARALLEVGLAVTDWLQLDRSSRAAFLAAARDLWQERAARGAALSASGELGALAALAPFDGGRDHATALRSAAVDGVARASAAARGGHRAQL